jgi:uncharacterized protein (TIGR03067 family)
MRAGLLLALAALSAGFAPVPPPRARKGLDLKALEGAWKVLRYEAGTPGVTPRPDVRVEIKDDSWTQFSVRDGAFVRSVACRLKVDGKKSPPRVEMSMQRTPGGPLVVVRRGVLELKGDTLTVTYTTYEKDPTPTRTGGELAQGQWRWVLKRERP